MGQESQQADHEIAITDTPRTYIFLALSCSPKFLIADEPTTAVDVTIQAQLLEIMKKLTEDIGTTLMIITHNLGVIAKYADRVNGMYAGHIVEKGTEQDIYGNPKHTYIIGLVASVPRLDRTIKEKLVPIEGLPPDLTNLPSGCAFYPCCGCAIDKCRREMPNLSPISDEHQVACWVGFFSKVVGTCLTSHRHN